MKRLLCTLLAFLLAVPAFAGNYVGDYQPGDTVDCNFGTVNPSTGASFTLGGTPAISVYKDNSTTESTTGVTLSADFDTRTGLNHLRVTTGSDGTFYSASSFFEAVITTGTVNSVSVVGQPVCSFTLAKVRPIVASIASGGISEASFATTAGSVAPLGITRQGTGQAASGSTSFTLDASAPFGDNTIIGQTLLVKGATNGNYWQSCGVTAYVASTKVATISCPSGYVTPTGTLSFQLWGTGPGGSAPTAAQVATAVWQDTTAGDFTVASSIGKSLYTSGATPGATGGLFIAGTNAATTITSALTTTFTGNLTGSIGSVGSGGITSSSFAANAIDANAIATDAIGSAELASSAATEIANATWAITMTEPTAKPVWTSGTMKQALEWVSAWSINKITQTSTTKTLRNTGDTGNLVTCAVSDNGTTFTQSACTP